MASAYWIPGGSGLWSDNNNWSLTSGGPNNTTAPNSATVDVFFDANSGNGTITGSASGVDVKTFTNTGFTGTFNQVGMIYLYGNTTLSVDATYGSNLRFIVMSGNCEFTSAGKTLQYITVYSGTLILKDTLNSVTHVGIQANSPGGATISTGNFNINCGTSFAYNGNMTRTLTLGSSVITCTSLNLSGTNLTMTANTAKFIVNQAATGAMSFSHGTAQFYDLELNGYNDANSVKAFAGNLTCTNSLKLAGLASNKKLWLKSSVPGTVRTITSPSVVVENCDFTDIKGAGDGWPSAVKNLFNSAQKWSSNMKFNGVQR